MLTSCKIKLSGFVSNMTPGGFATKNDLGNMVLGTGEQHSSKLQVYVRMRAVAFAESEYVMDVYSACSTRVVVYRGAPLYLPK